MLSDRLSRIFSVCAWMRAGIEAEIDQQADADDGEDQQRDDRHARKVGRPAQHQAAQLRGAQPGLADVEVAQADPAEQEQQQVGDADVLLVGDGGLDQDAPLRPLGGAAQIVDPALSD